MTIYALSTGPGVSGVAIIRISGPDASKVIKLLTKKDIPEPRMAILRKINNINTSEFLDEGIIIWFPGPQSYTGEDMVEIHVHGGKAIVMSLQSELSKLKNFRLADPIQNEDLFLMAEKQIKKIELENINIDKYKTLLKLYDQADIINDIV